MPSTSLIRALKIVRFLSIYGRQTTTEICMKIKSDPDMRPVSLKQIQRDVKDLEMVQILQKEGNGTWSVRKDSRNLLPLRYDENELLSLHVLKSYLTHFEGTSIGKDAAELMRKIEGVAQGEVFSTLTVEHIFGRFDYSKVTSDITKIIHCICNGHWVNVTYYNPRSHTEKTYPVFPCRLFVYNDELYAICYHEGHKSYLALAVRNIRNMEQRQEDRQKCPHYFDEEQFSKQRLGVFEGIPTDIRIHISAEVSEFFTNRIWHPSQHFIQSENGNTELRMRVPVSWELVTWLVGWQTHITVLEPQELIDEIVRYATAICGKYGGT